MKKNVIFEWLPVHQKAFEAKALIGAESRYTNIERACTAYHVTISVVFHGDNCYLKCAMGIGDHF